MSGVGSIALSFAQYIIGLFVLDLGRMRTWLLVPLPLIAVVCFYFAFYYTWRDEHRKVKKLEPLALGFRESLKRRCQELIVGLEDLDRGLRSTPDCSSGIQYPLEPGWIDSPLRIWPAKVCSYQKAYYELRNDLRSLKIPMDSCGALTTLPQLLAILKSHMEQISKLPLSEF